MAVTQACFKCSLGMRRDDANGGALVGRQPTVCTCGYKLPVLDVNLA